MYEYCTSYEIVVHYVSYYMGLYCTMIIIIGPATFSTVPASRTYILGIIVTWYLVLTFCSLHCQKMCVPAVSMRIQFVCYCIHTSYF